MGKLQNTAEHHKKGPLMEIMMSRKLRQLQKKKRQADVPTLGAMLQQKQRYGSGTRTKHTKLVQEMHSRSMTSLRQFGVKPATDYVMSSNAGSPANHSSIFNRLHTNMSSKVVNWKHPRDRSWAYSARCALEPCRCGDGAFSRNPPPSHGFQLRS